MLTQLDASLEKLAKLVREVDSKATQLPVADADNAPNEDTASAAKQLLQELDGAEAEWPAPRWRRR
jgi:hypothetical protein